MIGEPDPVTEERALRERARRIHRDDADAVLLSTYEPDERADQRRFPHARRAGDADPVGTAGVGVDLADEVVCERIAVLDEGDRPRERALVAGAHAGGQRFPRPRSGHEGDARGLVWNSRAGVSHQASLY